MSEIQKILKQLALGDKKSLARCITIIENELDGYKDILSSLQIKNIPVIGFTGPPGAGKSTLINALLSYLTKKNKKIGVIAIDPTSPFNFGSLLGDRLRMSEHFNDENIFIRSLATRGSLGGLSAKTIEIIDVMRAFATPSQPSPKGKEPRVQLSPFGGVGGGVPFDYIFIETVGVGQTEVEVAGLADTTVLVLAPGFGDEIQTIKSGIMEIGDIFVVNKSDNPGADGFATTIKNMAESKHLTPSPSSLRWNTESVRFGGQGEGSKNVWIPPVLKVIATQNEGIEQLINKINEHASSTPNEKKIFLLTEKAYKLIQNNRMKNLDKKKLQNEIEKEMKKKSFNLYAFVKGFDHS